MKACVSKTFRFEAAHRLLNHDGQCRELHGHSYRVVIHCKGPINEFRGHPKEGMVVDFADIKEVWKEYIEPIVDHRNLNETIGEVTGLPTTAENIAVWILEMFRANHVEVSQVDVWETESSCASVTWSDVWVDGRPMHHGGLAAA